MTEETNQIAAEGIEETPREHFNQYATDPRRKLAWEYYIDPESETFSNAYRSALKAGYAENTARQITSDNWWSAKVRRLQLLDKAEKVLDEMLELDTTNTKVTKEGDIVEQVDGSLVKTKQDTAKFVAERLGKEHYSNRSELTGKDGERIMPVLNEGQRSKLDALLGQEGESDDTD